MGGFIFTNTYYVDGARCREKGVQKISLHCSLQHKLQEQAYDVRSGKQAGLQKTTATVVCFFRFQFRATRKRVKKNTATSQSSFFVVVCALIQ